MITQALRDSLNVWSTPLLSHPVDRSDIRRWAIAVYWPEQPPRIFWDEDYSRTTKWGGIIAPREFNPFAWPIHRPPAVFQQNPKRGVGERGMNGGQTEEYGVPIRPGDVISSTSALVKLDERMGKLGLMLYRYTEIVWTNQNNEFVRRRTSIGIQY
jgi:hypothetical protein